MKAFYEARARKWCEKELHVRIKEICTHVRRTELKEDEEEPRQSEEVIKKLEEELRRREEQLKKHKKKRVMSFHCT
jgi:hypothetical protein